MLKVRNLNVSYGGIHAIRGIDIDVERGEIVTIIGSNGAGKSSLLNAVSGMVRSYCSHLNCSGSDVRRYL